VTCSALEDIYVNEVFETLFEEMDRTLPFNMTDPLKLARYWPDVTRKTLKHIRLSIAIISVITMMGGLTLLILGGIMAIWNSEEMRWISDSFMTSGIFSFMMSFLGFYGARNSGIKEYLKVYGSVMALKSLYEFIILIVYISTGGVKENARKIYSSSIANGIEPILVISLVMGLFVSVLIVLERNVGLHKRVGSSSFTQSDAR
jgi:hypothetical protein